MKKILFYLLIFAFNINLFSHENDGKLSYKDYCFPMGAFSILYPEDDTFDQILIRNIFDSLNELPMFNKNKNYIRFICENSFHSDYSITLTTYKNKIYLSSSTYNYDYIQDKYILVKRSKELQLSDIDNIIQLFGKYNYFNTNDMDKNMGQDGSIYYVEIKFKNRYIMLHEWNPEKGYVFELCNELKKFIFA